MQKPSRMANSLPLLATLLFTFLCCSQANLIKKVCSKATNASICTQILRSDPRFSRADLRGMGQIVIEKSVAATKDALGVVKTLNSVDPGAVHFCVDMCGVSIDDLNKCSEWLKGCGRGSGGEKKYCKSDLLTRASAAVTHIDSCNDAFIEGGSLPAVLQIATKRAEDLIDVVLAIVATL